MNLNNTVSFDLDGLSRPLDGDGINGAAMDIGPYEYCCVVNTKTNINPGGLLYLSKSDRKRTKYFNS
ncbi:MAG: hypothetical protein IPL42_14075 [Saprospiraceae bacterium]|nr:hypothetical protein [Saprospiraceae bacterium]